MFNFKTAIISAAIVGSLLDRRRGFFSSTNSVRRRFAPAGFRRWLGRATLWWRFCWRFAAAGVWQQARRLGGQAYGGGSGGGSHGQAYGGGSGGGWGGQAYGGGSGGGSHRPGYGGGSGGGGGAQAYGGGSRLRDWRRQTDGGGYDHRGCSSMAMVGASCRWCCRMRLNFSIPHPTAEKVTTRIPVSAGDSSARYSLGGDFVAQFS